MYFVNYDVPVDGPEVSVLVEHGGYIDEGIENVWNSPYFKNARKAMLAGDKVANHLLKSPCEKCYAEERGGMTSDRQNHNDKYTKYSPHKNCVIRACSHSHRIPLIDCRLHQPILKI